MFKNEEQVATFIDLLEKFSKAVMNTHPLLCESDSIKEMAAHLNRTREKLEEFIKTSCGITYVTGTEPQEYLCPECDGAMMLRTNRQNGDKFYGCKKYPNCRGTRDSSGLSREEREHKKEQAVQQSGFTFNRDKRDPVAEVSPPASNTSWKNPFDK